jgi:hypothetical protein
MAKRARDESAREELHPLIDGAVTPAAVAASRLLHVLYVAAPADAFSREPDGAVAVRVAVDALRDAAVLGRVLDCAIGCETVLVLRNPPALLIADARTFRKPPRVVAVGSAVADATAGNATTDDTRRAADLARRALVHSGAPTPEVLVGARGEVELRMARAPFSTPRIALSAVAQYLAPCDAVVRLEAHATHVSLLVRARRFVG